MISVVTSIDSATDEIASCHFDLGSFDVVNVPLVDGTAAFLREIGLRGVLEVGLQKRCEHVDVVDDGTVQKFCALSRSW